MKKGFQKVITYLLVLIILVSIPTTTVNAAKSTKSVTVATQKQLDTALNSSKYKTITIKTSKEVMLSIPNNIYSDKSIIVNASKVIIENQASFKSITIINNANGSWTESGINNSFTISSTKSKLVVGKTSVINNIIVNKASGVLNLVVYGGVNNLTVNKKSTINVSGYSKKELPIIINAKNVVINDNILNSNIENKSKGNIFVYVNDTKVIVAKGEKKAIENTAAETDPNENGIEANKEAEVSDSAKKENKVGEVAKTGASSYSGGGTSSGGGSSSSGGSSAGGSNTGGGSATPIPVHSHMYTSTVTTAASCITEGVTTYTCEFDGESYTESIPASGHTLGEWEVTKEATETETGLRVQKCTVCNEVVNEEVLPKIVHSHIYTSMITKEATCTNDGIKTYTCSSCNDTYTEAIPAIGHTLGEWEVTKEATETETGLRVQKCTVCGEVINSEEISIVAHSHNYIGVVTTEPTCGVDGVKTYTCSICGDSYTETIPTTISHSYVGSVTEAPETVAGSSINEGTVTYTCINCGDTYAESMLSSVGQVKTVELEVTDGVTPESATGRDNYALAYEVFVAVNAERVSLGLNELTWDNTMDDYTQLRAAEVTQKFSHTRPNGEHGYEMNEIITSENVGAGQATSEEVMAAWKASTAHYNAIINPDYTSIAIGCFEEQLVDFNGDPTGDTYTGWIQFFHEDETPIIG